MLSPRAPLFSVSLAFAIGCVLALDGWIGLPVALIACAISGLIWLLAARHEALSLAAFYLFAACAGLAWTLLQAQAIAPDDLRNLPEEKGDQTTQWRGIIIEEPVAQNLSHASHRALDRTTFTFRLQAWRPTGGRFFGADIDAPWQTASGDVACTVLGDAKELLCGDELEFAAAFTPIAPPLCPGGLDLPAYDARQGIFYETTVSSLNWRRVATGGGDWWQNLSFRARDWAYDRLQLGLEDDPRMADLLAGILIGYRQEIPPDIEQDFRRTGTIHVFAVSGQKVVQMVVVALVLLQLCGLVRWRWAWAVAPVVLLYCLLTGSPAPAVRATEGVLAILLAWKLGRPLNALGCWSLAFLAMLLWDPTVLLDPGAQLSFAIVLGLILLAPPIFRLFIRPFEPDPFLPGDLLSPAQRREKDFWWWLIALLATGVAATITAEPITAITFHQVTPISILANLIVIPTLGLIVIIGTLSITTSLLSTTLAGLLNNANWLLAKILILFVGWLAHEPGAAVNVPDLRTRSSPVPGFVVAPLQDSACLLVRTSRGAWLVNTGRETPAPSTVWHLLQFYGINRLDGIVLAQVATADNGGAAMLVRDFRPTHLIMPALPTRSPVEKTLNEAFAQNHETVETWQQGQSVVLGDGVTVQVLHPAADESSTHADDRGLVLFFHAGDQTLLWAGRAGPTTQQELAASYPNLRADVLVMGTEPPPDVAWLASLQVRDWLQIPPHDRYLNTPDIPVPDFCQVWNLTQTGSVEISFQPGAASRPPEIRLRPWLALPQ
jgi:ComEC/Rec2-related protein